MKVVIQVLAAFLLAATLSSCATLIGGSKYTASVEVDDNPQAKIYYKDKYQGTGIAKMQINRSEANKVVFTVKQEGCEDQSFNFSSRKFRGGGFVCSILFWSINTGGFPLPVGGAIDVATGAIWKPDNTEFGVTKQNYKNFKYTVDYTKCQQYNNNPPTQPSIPTINTTVDVVYLKNGSIIKGSIIEMVPDQHIKLKTSDGSLFVFNVSDVLKTTREDN